jgi:hypothetical protein
MSQPMTFALERIALQSLNYYERLVDRDGLPYFNVFWTEPAEAAHDWPDFGDVIARQLQGVIMLRHMTGREAATEKVWYRKLLAYLDPQDGLLYRPQTSFSQRVADWGDAALTLYALVTAYVDNGGADLRRAIHTMVTSLLARARASGLPAGWIGGFIIKSLMACVRYAGSEAALELARLAVQSTFAEHGDFTPDNVFHGHMHGGLRALVGAADYALYVGDAVLYSRVDALYRSVRSLATRFGFLPEVVWRRGDIVACETCALMDYAGLGVTLANHGHPEYWGDMERLVRNHLVESQINDTSWLHSDVEREDTAQFSWREIGPRLVGAWAGWSSPNHVLACKENLMWGGPELRGKTRAVQNCCGGSGLHALFILWKNAARFENGCLTVNLHVDKKLPQAEIRGFQPYQGLLRIRLAEPCAVKVRIPDFTTPASMRVTADGQELTPVVWGNYLELGVHAAGQVLEVHYSLPLVTEEVIIGNPGYRPYHYRATWKGDTVVQMDPIGNDDTTGYSDFEQVKVTVYYGQAGPGSLYQRQAFLDEVRPALETLYTDSGKLDFWFLK